MSVVEGKFGVDLVNGCATVVDRFASYPLRFLFTPAENRLAVWAYVITFGGGIVGGDRVKFSVSVDGYDCVCVLTTQASTKVFKKRGLEEVSEQHIDMFVGEGSFLCVVPEPVTCFSGASFRQQQEIRLKSNSSLLFVDWISSGRPFGLGDVWAMDKYENKISIYVEDKLVFLEHVVLANDVKEKQIVKRRMGKIHVIATVVLIGPALLSNQNLIASLPESGRFNQDVDISRGPLIHECGISLRLAGTHVEAVRKLLDSLFTPHLCKTVGGKIYRDQ